jgi:hypothetical protein
MRAWKAVSKAADLRQVGKDSPDQLQRAQRLRLVQRSEIDQRVQPLQHLFVDQNRRHELAAAVDDPVTDGIDASHPLEFRPQRRLVDLPAREGRLRESSS